MPVLKDWEEKFRETLQRIDESKRQKAGALLSVLPNHADWDEFLDLVKTEWQYWRNDLSHFSYCLIVLYDGLAFYEYDANRFWPQFSEAVGEKLGLPGNRQGEINGAFARAAETYGLKIRRRPGSTDYVGSAVHHIGVPLSLWDGFLEICEWALAHDDWMELSDEEWSEVVDRRAGGRTRLKNFLTDNRDASSAFLQEMHDARRILIEDQDLTISDLQQASLLRQEYFDEVPETAEFLRPEDPDSLISDRARLVWDENRVCIELHLPAVPHDKLPATWKVSAFSQEAASTPDTLTLNAGAFGPSLVLKLESGQKHESQRLRGIVPWGLFDSERCRFVNPESRQFPIHSYTLVAPKPLDEVSRRGFDEEESPINECYEFEDGSPVYVTRLWPVDKHAELSVTHNGETRSLHFRPRFKIEARIFAGEGGHSANFSRYNEYLKLERLPLLCIAIPFGSFSNPERALQQKFRVCAGDQLSQGMWEKFREDDSREFYSWRWESGSQPRKKVNVSIRSPELGIKFDYPVEILLPKVATAGCWQNFPGAFLPWLLLAQTSAGTIEGMKWSDLMLAKEAIAPAQRGFSEALLHKYARYGLLEKRGVRWVIADSRAVVEPSVDGECNLRFCGDPSVLWSLFRYMSDKTSNLPIIEIVNIKGELPFLLMRWQKGCRSVIEKYLQNHHINLVSDLWS